MQYRAIVLVLALVGVVGWPTSAQAHDLRATVKLLPDTVLVEAGFDDIPAQEAAVRIVDAAGHEVARGKTDGKGVCRLPLLGPGKYLATVESIGHRDEVAFEIAGSSGDFEFSNWRLDKRVGLAIGLGGLFALTTAFWWFRLRRPAP
jgi:hypothetical protein